MSLCWFSVAWAGPPQPAFPTFGSQNSDNRYYAKLTLLKTIDFESDADLIVLSPNVSLTTDPGLVLQGSRSLLLSGPEAAFVLSPRSIDLEPLRTYVIEYDYRILQRKSKVGAIAVFFAQNPILDLGGPSIGTGLSGTDRRGVRIGPDPGTLIGMHSFDADVVVDSVRVYRQDTEVRASKPALWETGFPRIAAYSLTRPEAVAFRHDVSVEEVERTLAGFDVVTGVDGDQTLGMISWVSRLRDRNPKLRLLPYQQSFIAQELNARPMGTSAGLNALFNAGLAPEWFMVDSAGQRLSEPAFPQNVQMNHTKYCSSIGGYRFSEYKADYIARAVLPSGLWDGVHFDQPEWYPNPLLQRADGTFPAIDLARRGTADTPAEVHTSWRDAFFDFFQPIVTKAGQGQLIFGNAGYIAANRKVLSTLNGWLREVVTPYDITSSGDWVTEDGAGWHRMMDRYFTALEAARAPQLIFMEFMGQGLGAKTGQKTPNGYSARTLSIEARDYRRMRLGLTSVLLGDGFFGYDLIDNTSPPVWFDEYSVDGEGRATRDLTGKGYLGQPLGPAIELPYEAKTILSLDFESSSLPPGVQLGANARISRNPAEVIAGQGSLVATQGSSSTDPFIFATLPETIALKKGKTYQLIADYQVLEYNPVTFKGLGGVSLTSRNDGLTTYRTASLYQPDVEGPGQRGTFRTSVKATTDGFVAAGALTDNGAMALDNVRLIEGAGGVWRREFEHGIVLVNPTTEPATVSVRDLQGSRTGVRRIRGLQAPDWNTGLPVNSPITIPPGDGIILLADTINAAVLAIPRGTAAAVAGDQIAVTWQPNTEYVAGYIVQYGEDPRQLTREVAFARRANSGVLSGIEPSATVYLRVAAHDFLGNRGPYGDLITVQAGGEARIRPDFDPDSLAGGLTPGGRVEISGANLATAEMTADASESVTELGSAAVVVNGIAARLIAVAPNHITALVPADIGGEYARINVFREGIPAKEIMAPVRVTLEPSLVAY